MLDCAYCLLRRSRSGRLYPREYNGDDEFMGTMSPLHWLVVLVVVLLVFGPKRLGDVGKGLGQGLRGLREGLAGRDPEAPPPAPTGSDPNKADSKQA